MTCKKYQNQFDDYCSGELKTESLTAYESHLPDCSVCSRAVEEHFKLVASLKAMPIVGPSEGFTEHVMAEVEDRNNSNHHHGFVVGFGSATVAALALWLIVGVNPVTDQDANNTSEIAKQEVEETIPEFSIALNEQRDIRLAFYSSEDLNDAQIKLRMPENIVLVGFPGQRELVWKTNLSRGDNLLRLPVVATGSAGGQLIAQIEYKGKVKILKVNLAVGTKDLSGNVSTALRIV